jgi:hypothetical protein
MAARAPQLAFFIVQLVTTTRTPPPMFTHGVAGVQIAIQRLLSGVGGLRFGCHATFLNFVEETGKISLRVG